MVDVTMDGIELAINFIIFDYKGRVENDLTIFKGQNYLFINHGKLIKDAFYIQSLRVFVGTLNTSYRSNKFGQVLTGEHHINGDDYYFQILVHQSLV